MADTRQAERPLSPHLQIYRGGLSMLLSIVHRATGIVLYAGTLLLVWWLSAAAVGDAYFAFVQGIFGSWFGLLVLFGFTWALVHHAVGGIRHLIWDMGRGLEVPAVAASGRIAVASSVVITIALWILAFGVLS